MSELDDVLIFGEKAFATGASRYWDAHPDRQEALSRIYVQFRPVGVAPALSFMALLDTGAHYCLLNEKVASLVEGQLTDDLGEVTLRTPYGEVRGRLYSHRIVLLAQIGNSLDLPATLLVVPGWQGPCFLGYSGVLDRMRFAIDADNNRFYFDSIY